MGSTNSLATIVYGAIYSTREERMRFLVDNYYSDNSLSLSLQGTHSTLLKHSIITSPTYSLLSLTLTLSSSPIL